MEASKKLPWYVGRLCVSRAIGPSPSSPLMTIAPAEEKGYGPNFEARKSMISGSCASASGSMRAPGL